MRWLMQEHATHGVLAEPVSMKAPLKVDYSSEEEQAERVGEYFMDSQG